MEVFVLDKISKNDTQNFCQVLYWHGIFLLHLMISGKFTRISILYIRIKTGNNPLFS